MKGTSYSQQNEVQFMPSIKSCRNSILCENDVNEKDLMQCNYFSLKVITNFAFNVHFKTKLCNMPCHQNVHNSSNSNY